MRFTDKLNRTWAIELDVTTIRNIKRRLGVDLLTVDRPGADALARLIADPELLVNAIWLCCQEQAAERQISDDDFGRGLGGEAIDEATRALLEALADFSRGPGGRQSERRWG